MTKFTIVDIGNKSDSYLSGIDINHKLIINALSFSQEELNNEEWRCIADLPIEYKDQIKDKDKLLYDANSYYVSNLGRIAELKDGKLYLIRVSNTQRYKKCRIRINNSYHEYKIHRLVAYLFCYNYDVINKVDINHIKEFETYNNKASNLEWVTHKENANYGTKNERVSMSQINNNKTKSSNNHVGIKRDDVKRKIKCINIQTCEILEFDSIDEASLTLKISNCIINKHCISGMICNNTYKFEYNDNIGVVKRKLRTEGLEPIVRLDNDYQFKRLYLYKGQLESEYKIPYIIDACLCKGQSIYYGMRWMFLSDYNNYLKECNCEPIFIPTINIVRVATYGYKFMKLYTNLYDLINDNYNLDHVIKSCDKNHDFNNLIKTHYTWMYLEDYLRYKGYLSIDDITEKDKINPKRSSAVSKCNQQLKDRRKEEVNDIIQNVYERMNEK